MRRERVSRFIEIVKSFSGFVVFGEISVAAESLIDLLQTVRQHSVVGHASHHREALVAAASHQMDVVLKVSQAVPLRNLVDVHVHLGEGRWEEKRKRMWISIKLSSFVFHSIFLVFSGTAWLKVIVGGRLQYVLIFHDIVLNLSLPTFMFSN